MNTNKMIVIAVLFSGVSYAQTLKDAVYKTDNERFVEATADFKKLITAEPANGVNYFYFGENFYEKGDVDSAIVIWNQGLQACPTSPMSLVGSGKALWVKGNKDGAKAEFTKALAATKNKNAEVMRGIAESYIESENKSLDEAITLLELATKIDPKNEDGHLLMGDALLEKTPANGSPAIKSYNKVLEINPKSARGIVRVAKLYQRAQNYEEADKYYQQAKAIDPTYAPAYRENAELYMMFKRSDKAIDNWKKYLDLNNSNDARYRFVTAMFQGKQFCEVIPEIELLKNKGYNNFYLERMLTYSNYECATAADGAKKGLEASDRFFQMVPQEKIIYMDYKYKGLLLSKAGSDSLAIVELEKASELDKDAALELAGDIGRLYMKMKKYDKVVSIYEFKRNSQVLSATEQFELGRAYFFGPKDYLKSDSAFIKLLELSPTYTPGYYWRARVAYQLDPTKANWMAKPYLEKVIEMVKPEERSAGPNKTMVMEAAKYMGDYYVNSKEKDIAKARTFWTIVEQLDPADKQAAAFFKANGK